MEMYIVGAVVILMQIIVSIGCFYGGRKQGFDEGSKFVLDEWKDHIRNFEE